MLSLLDFIFPKFCVSCGRIGAYICNQCKKTIEPIELYQTICPMCERPTPFGRTHPYCQERYGLDGLICFYRYRGAIKKAIKKIKYQFLSDIVKALIPAKQQIHYPWLDGSTIVPIPLHSSRYRFRGFNQAELIGKELATLYHLPLSRDMIQRIKSTLPQVEMKTKKDRIKNMKGMFGMVKNKSVPKQILLVDDVFTTGATMREAGSVLKHHGAEVIWGMTIAR